MSSYICWSCCADSRRSSYFMWTLRKLSSQPLQKARKPIKAEPHGTLAAFAHTFFTSDQKFNVRQPVQLIDDTSEWSACMDNKPAHQGRKYILSIYAKTTSCPISIQLPIEQTISPSEAKYPICGEMKMTREFPSILREAAMMELSVSTHSAHKELPRNHETLHPPEFKIHTSTSSLEIHDKGDLSTNNCPLSESESVSLTTWFDSSDDSDEASKVLGTGIVRSKVSRNKSPGKPHVAGLCGSLVQKPVPTRSERDSSKESTKASWKGRPGPAMVQGLLPDDLKRSLELSYPDVDRRRSSYLTTPEILSLQMPKVQNLTSSEENLSPKYVQHHSTHQSVVDAIAHTQAGEWMCKYTRCLAAHLERDHSQEFYATRTFHPFPAGMAKLTQLSKRWFRLIASDRAITWTRRQSEGSERATSRGIRKCESA